MRRGAKNGDTYVSIIMHKQTDMKKAFTLLFFAAVAAATASAQSVVLKHNVLLDVVHSPNFSLEAEIGAGYAYVDYDKFACGKCGTLAKDGNSNYWGITRAGLSLVYVLK